MNFFKRARTPEELVLKCCNAYEELAKAGSTGATRQAVRHAPTPALPVPPRAHSRLRTQALDHVVKYTGEMKTMQFGDPTTDKAPKDEDGKLLAQEAAKSKLLTHMCTQLTPLGFEARCWWRRAAPWLPLTRKPWRSRRRARTSRRSSAACCAAPATARSPASTTCSSTRSSSAP